MTDIKQVQQEADTFEAQTATSLEPIIQLMRSNDPRWRMAALQFLLRSGERAKEAIPSLRSMLEAPELDTRTWARMALEAIEGDDRPEKRP